MGNTKQTGFTFKKLMTGNIICSIVTLAMVVVVIVLTFAFVTSNPSEEGAFGAYTGTLLAFGIIELVCDVTLIIFMALSLVKVNEVSKINATTFRITFGILLGLFVLFWIIGIFVSALAFFQLVTLIVILVFTIIYRGRAK